MSKNLPVHITMDQIRAWKACHRVVCQLSDLFGEEIEVSAKNLKTVSRLSIHWPAFVLGSLRINDGCHCAAKKGCQVCYDGRHKYHAERIKEALLKWRKRRKAK